MADVMNELSRILRDLALSEHLDALLEVVGELGDLRQIEREHLADARIPRGCRDEVLAAIATCVAASSAGGAGSREGEDVDLATLPFPVAYPLAFARKAELPAGDRVTNLIFTAYQAMRTAALVMLADYMASDTICRDLVAPVRGLRLPHWGEWTSLASKLVQFWRGKLGEKPERASFVPNLVAGWDEIQGVTAPRLP